MGPMGDMQLAIAIARVYEGDNGPVLRRLLEDEILALAAQEGDRWLASWAFWMLRRKDMAVRALIVSIVIVGRRRTGPSKERVGRKREEMLISHPADARLHTNGDASFARPQVAPVPDRRSGLGHSLCAAAAEDFANPQRCIQGNTKGGVGVCLAQRSTVRSDGL
jgi:hypothetical protein